MRYFFAALAVAAAVLITLKPELFKEIVTTALMVGGIMALLPAEGEEKEG